MICKNCYAENEENAVFCSNCGARFQVEAPVAVPEVVPVAEPAPAPIPQTAPAPQPVVVQVENKSSRIPDEYKPVSPWGYFGLNILYCIPIVGFIFLLIHTFNGSNLNRRNYARSYWCAVLVGVILALVILILIFVVAAISGIAVNEIASNYYY